MVAAAERGQVALTRPAALVIGKGVVVVAADGGPAAAGERTGRLPDRDQVPQAGRRPVGARLPQMAAVTRLQPADERCRPAIRVDRRRASPGRLAVPRGDPPLRGGRRGGGRERPDGPGPVRAQPWATGLPPSPVRVMHQRLPGCPASRAARSRESPASSGPYPAAWPGASDRPSQVASGHGQVHRPTWPVPATAGPGRTVRSPVRRTRRGRSRRSLPSDTCAGCPGPAVPPGERR